MKIWAAWIQGRANAPSHVKKIFDLWEKLNPDHELVVLEKEQISKIVSELGVKQNITPQIQTNLVRLFLLREYGGVWADSTVLPTIPLDKWLTSDLRRSGFFAFSSSGLPELVLQTWFLYAEKNNKLVKEWLAFYADYFKRPRYYATLKRAIYHGKLIELLRHKQAIKNKDLLFFVDPKRGRDCSFYPYPVVNLNLKYLLNTKPCVSEVWGNTPRLYNKLPSMISDWASDPDTPTDNFIEMALQALPLSPVHKLNYRDARFDLLIDRWSEQ